MQIRQSIDIDAAPEKIWHYLSQPLNISKWYTTFRRCEYTGRQRSGVGLTFYVEEKAGGTLMKINFTVTEWKENQELAFKMTSGNFVRDYRQRWTIDPTPSGSRFTLEEEIVMPWGIAGNFLGMISRSSSEKHVKAILIKLKILAES